MKQNIINLVLIIGIAIFANVLGNIFFNYVDMTEDNRFTLTDSTVEMIEDIETPVYIRVLLGGEYPAGIKRLRAKVMEKLSDFRAINANIEFILEDPMDGPADEVRQRQKMLEDQQILPVRLDVKEQDGRTAKIYYPYAIIQYGNRTSYANLMEAQIDRNIPPQQIINNSISLLEYKLANAIQQVQRGLAPTIAFLSGHGELDDEESGYLQFDLKSFYNVGRFHLDSALYVPQDISALVIAKPQTAFSTKDKFKLDQYVMNGGKILWMLDYLNVEMDSLRTNNNFVPTQKDLNLDDLLFKYGVRIQPNLIKDLSSSTIKLVSGQQGGQPQFQAVPWPYHPLVISKDEHPIVKNIGGPISFQFPSRIDTIETRDNYLKKTVLLSSSPNANEQFIPMRLNFDFLNYRLDPKKFNKANLPVAVVNEGTFTSGFKNWDMQGLPEALTSLGQEFKTSSVPTKQIFISDGDVGKSSRDPRTKQIKPVGYNVFAEKMYYNKDFMINCVEYLLDDSDIMEARGKKVKLRLLNQVKAKSEKTKWQLINILVPLILLIQNLPLT